MLAWITSTLQGVCETRHVLILYDERTELPGLTMIDAGIARTLASGSEIEIYREVMDNSRFGSPVYRNLLREHLRAKYAGKRIDVAVAVMGSALDFLLSHRAVLFAGSPETPIVFCGIDRRTFGDRPLPPGVTGVLLKREFAPTLKLSLDLHPGTERIVVVSGNSDFDLSLLEQAREEFRPFEDRLAFTYPAPKPLRELVSELSRLPPHTLVLYTTMFRDGANNAHVPHQALERIAAAANAPVYGFVDQYLGRGMVGGRVYSLGAHGEAAGELVLKILAGSRPSELPPIEPVNSVPMFDWRQLKHWNISEEDLPPGSTILFRELSVWQQYKWHIIVIIGVCIAQAALISLLLVNLVKRRRAERSVTETEARFRVAAEASPVMMWMSGTDKLCTFFNKAWLQFTGRTLEQELGNGWVAGVHPDDKAACLKTYEGAFDARREFTMEYRVRRHDGEYAWVLDTGAPRFTVDRTFAGYIGSATDITEHKLAEERLRSIVESAPNAMLVANSKGHITLVNARTEEVFGYSREELLGNPVEMLLPEPWRAQYPALREQYVTNPTPRSIGVGHELFGLRKNGSLVPLEIGLSPMRTPEGQFVLASIIDITERRVAVANLRETEKRMTMAAEAAHLGMWVWEAHEPFIWTSANWNVIHGYAPGERIRFEALIQRVHADDRDGVGRAVTDAFNNQSSFFVEHRVILPDGNVRWISATGRVERADNNGSSRLLGISIDITERKDAEEAAREVSGKLITAQEDERRRIARDLHDDLNQRLALLSVETDLLGRLDNNPEAQPLIEGIASRVRGLSSEVHKLSYQLHPAKLEQLGLIAAVRSFCHELSKQWALPIEFVHDPIPRDLSRGVALCFYRIVQEALHNVIKHSQAAHARVEVRREGDEIRLVVSDDGRGFDMSTVNHHAGLGLVGMRERVRLVGGHASFHSAPGQGTRIEVVARVTLEQATAK